MLVLESLAVAVVLLATVTDLLENKIYNVLTGPAMLAGVLGHLAGSVWWWEGVAGAFAVGAPFFVLYAFDILKAGDVKLLMAVGALLGLKAGGVAAVMSIIAWAPIGVGIIMVNRELIDWRHLFSKDHKPLLVPFGAAIAIGTLLAIRMVH